MNHFERIQLVILSYNRLDCLPRLFEELLLPASKLEVLVTFIDNNSNEELQTFLDNYLNIPNIEIIINNENLGVSKGRNIGFKNSKREYVVYLDDDSIIELDDLKLVTEIFDSQPDAGILAFRIIHGLSGSSQNDHGNELIMVGNFHGAGHAIRKDLFQKIGYLDENCFFGAEEIEFSMHALGAGYKTMYTPEILVRHFSFQRQGKDNFQRRINWARNYSMVLFRYLPFFRAFLFSFRLLISYSISEKNHLIIFLPFAMIQGAIKGLKSKNLLSKDAIAFYTNPATRPEIGNVSLIKKIFK